MGGGRKCHRMPSLHESISCPVNNLILHVTSSSEGTGSGGGGLGGTIPMPSV